MRTSTAAVIRDGRRFLFVLRPTGGDLSECWELPGGKVDAGEDPPQALRRELREELGLDATVGELVGEAQFEHQGQTFRLLAFDVRADLAAMVLHEHEEYGFYTAEEAKTLRLAPSDALLLAKMKSTDHPE